MRRFLFSALAFLALALAPSELDAQKRCTKGKPCGNSCIAQDKVCRIGAPTTTTSPPPAARQVQPPTTTGAFVASSRGTVYYPSACSAAKDLAAANRIYFKSEQEAQAAGYRRTTNRACAQHFGVSSETPPPALDGGSCTVRSVTDGDTFACTDGRRVRLLLIDAPEMDQGPYGGDARRALAALLPSGAQVGLELDVEKQDRYGRVLAYVRLADGRMVNEEIARAGYVVVSVYPPNVQHVERMRAAVKQAQEARRGLWSTPAFQCSPADHRAGRCD